jgi:RHS repeat-associated protein
MSNRLSSTRVGSETIERYTYDPHGSMTSMTHLPAMRWDYGDRLQASGRQMFNGGTPETTYYVYDASGQRVRKVTEREAASGVDPTRMKERLYLGGLEIYREYDTTGSTVTLERETLHVISDQQPFALVDTRTLGDDRTPVRLVRYQLANHSHSVSIELDDRGDTISYQEYYPYGSTSYQAGSLTGTSMAARYLFTGQERDEESGLYHHGARYYAPWLGRWTACDPIGTQGGVCLYAYVRNSPPLRTDPEGTQDTAMRAAMEVYYARLETDVEGYITGFFGGHAAVSTSQNTVEYEGPTGGVGGVTGGIIRVISLRLIPFEERPTIESLVGGEAGGSLVPVMDPSQRLALGTTVTGQPTSRLWAAGHLAMDVVPLGLELHLAAVEARTASVVTRVIDVETGELMAAERVGVVAERTAPASRPASGGLPIYVARDVPSRAARTGERVREVVIPLSRTAGGIERGTVERAELIARERGAVGIWLEELGNYPDVERVVFVGHANEYSFAGRTAAELNDMLLRAGVRPSVIELVGCETAKGEALLARDLSFYSSADVIGYERQVHLGSGVVSDALVITDEGWDPLIPSPAEPITFRAPLRAR